MISKWLVNKNSPPLGFIPERKQVQLQPQFLVQALQKLLIAD